MINRREVTPRCRFGSGFGVAGMVCAILVSPSGAVADTADTLPRGVGRARVRPIYSYFSQRWDQDGNAEAVTHDLDGRDLNSDVFPDLSILERVYGMEGGALSLGTSHVSSQVHINVLALAAEYGVTDRITVGIVLPVIHGWHRVTRLRLAPETGCDAQRCGMGRNPGDTNISTDDSTYLPLDHDKDLSTRPLEPLTTEDVQEIMVDDLGYQRLESWNGVGIGDLELGAKVRLVKLGPWQTAVQGGVRVPTGRVDDPDNLFDIGFGDGQTDLGLYWQNDFRFVSRLRLNVTARYTIQFPDHQFKRVPTSVDVPLAKEEDAEEVWRDLGDVLEVDLSAEYQISELWFAFARYLGSFKQRDRVKGNQGLSYESLRDETATRNHQLEVGVGFSNLARVVEGQADLPIDAVLSYQRSVAGINNAPIANVLAIELATYFKVF